MTRVSGLSLALVAAVVTILRAGPAIVIVGPTDDVYFGQLINAPNGHISFMPTNRGYQIWVPGRDPGPDQEGGFLLEVPDWNALTLKMAVATFGLGPEAPRQCPSGDNSFDRNYGAINAVVRGSDQHTLLAFYDAEFHPVCDARGPQGQPLLSSIGLATSIDGGMTWQKQGQIMPGLDEATLTFAFVTGWQQSGGQAAEDDGASGPSVVVREDDHERYLFLYYDDRTTLHSTYGDARKDSVYVARARLATNGMPGDWQQWTGAGWGAAGDMTVAAPIVSPPQGDGVALQPHVSWNTALHCWLMVFKTKADFSVTTSADGVEWSTPVSLLAKSSSDADFGFPTLVSLDPDDCHGAGCYDDAGERLWIPGADVSQQITGATGYLYWSSKPSTSTGSNYIGHRVAFEIAPQPWSVGAPHAR